MIPLKLTLEGLYSYRDRQEIDFTNLTRSGLFGIFGGVGSGKSTILEAMSFALYGESQRLNAKGDNRQYNMMNLKSDRLFIDFEFKTGEDQRYRFVVEGKRNSKKFEEVKSFERSAYKMADGTWEPVDVATVESITRLNYDNFHRTIIIPQGKFQEFMQLSPTERTKMLMELFDLSRYDLADKVGKLDYANNIRINSIENEMKGIGEVQPGEIDELEQKKSGLDSELLKLKQQNEDLLKKEHLLETLKKLTDDLLQKKKQFELLKSGESQIIEADRRLREFEKLERIFRSDLAQIESMQQSVNQNKIDFDNTNFQLKSQTTKLEQLDPVYQQIKKEYEQKDRLIRHADELDQLVIVKELDDRLHKVTSQAETIRQKLEVMSGNVNQLKEKLNSKSVEINQLKADLPDIKVLTDIKSWFVQKKKLQSDITESNKKIRDFTHELTGIREELLAELNRSGLFGMLTKSADLTEYLDAIGLVKQKEELNLERIRLEKSQLEVQHKLEEYATGLHDGKPCPLCGSTAHPKVLDPTDVKARLNSVLKDERASLGKLDLVRQFAISVSNAENKVRLYIGQKETEQAKLQRLDSEFLAHSGSFSWEKFDPQDETRVDKEFSRFDLLINEIREGEKQIADMNNRLIEEEKSLEINRKEHAVAEKEETGIKTRILTLNEQLKSLNIAHYQEYSIEKLKTIAAETRGKYRHLVEDFKEKERNFKELQQSVDLLKGQVISKESNLKSLEEQVGILFNKIDNKLRENNIQDLAYVKNLLAWRVDIDTERTRIESFYRELSGLQAAISEKEKELAGRNYDALEHERLRLESSRLKGLLEQMGKEIGKIEENLNRIRKDAERLAILQAELEQLILRKQDLDVMKKLFWSAGFVNFVSTIYLQNLCKAANERFYRLTRQKLGLELSSDNSFMVRDYMNEGRLRSAKSLSGGQTFQASLSLALSLADSIHRNAGSSENFFFLDEGFGSLDKENLEIAFDALKSLRKENRIVGVISHVEEMQAEIETFLKITNDEEHGSVVQASWQR